MQSRHFFLAATLLATALALVGCGGPVASGSPGATSTATSSGTPTTGATTVNVTLQEFAVLPATATAPAGDITFVVTNTGPNDVHEFVIVQTDLAPDALPTDATGAAIEGGQGMTVINEIEDLAVGASEDLTVTLEAGNYALICNIYDEDEQEAHYQMGMFTGFTVE